MRRPSSRPVVALVAAATGVLLAACGGTASTATSQAAPASGTPSESAPAAPAEITVPHAQGETTVPVEPQTVVTFDVGSLDTLHALGVDVAGVPDIVTVPERLEEYTGDGYAKVGTLFEPDYEAVNALEPDLIIVGSRSAAVYAELAEIAPTIDLTVDNTDFVASFKRHLETLGRIFAVEDQAAEESARLDARIEEVSEIGAEAGTGLIVLTTGGELSAYGPGSRFGIVHDLLGVTPAVEGIESATHGDAISFEFILEADPDHLFVIDRDATIGESGVAAEAMLDNEIVAQTTAWQEGDVHYLDGLDWYVAPTGLPAIHRMIDEVETALS